MSGREVTLVLCTSTGRLLGALPQYGVASPYWQDVEQVTAQARAVHGVDPIVLRILRTDRDDAREGGAVTYLAQVDEPPQVALRAWSAEVMREHRLRLDYARPGGPQHDVQWAVSVLAQRGQTLTGRPQQVRTWNLSSIWRLPTSAGVVWLKVVPPFLSREAAIVTRLPAVVVPPVLAAQHTRVLLADVAGADQYEATGADLLAMVDLLLAVQHEWVPRADELLELGAVDWRRASIPARVAGVVEMYGDQLAAAQRRRIDHLVRGLEQRLREVEQCGLPDTLVHGDFHPGNLRGTAPDFAILDWGEVGLGHPMLDQLTFTGRLEPADRAAVADHWSRRWRHLVPGSDPARAATLLQPVRRLMDAVVYDDFLNRIEPDERCYHIHDPLRSLRAAGNRPSV